jgi:multicomponent Na+:H+ antiporter subunit E
LKMYSRVITFSVSLLLWLLLAFSLDWQHLLLGLIVSLLVAAMMGDMFTEYAHKWFSPRRYFWFIVFIFVFIWECIKANFDVAWIVLHPKMPINPGIVKIKTSLKNETALTFLANFITLTPGTFSVDIDRENGCLYIHWIYVQTQDIEEATRIISAKFERILKEVFE